MNEQQAVRESNATMHFQARNRLKSEGLTFHNPELAYLYESYQEEMRAWEGLGAIDMAQECRIALDELVLRDENEEAAFEEYWTARTDAYNYYTDQQNEEDYREVA